MPPQVVPVSQRRYQVRSHLPAPLFKRKHNCSFSIYHPSLLNFYRLRLLVPEVFSKHSIPPLLPLPAEIHPHSPKTMSDTQQKPWSDNPNAPKVPYDVYFAEKSNFAGVLIAAVFYGMSGTPNLHVRLYVFNRFVLGFLIMLFFQCMAALLNPVNSKREGIKWGLVCYIVLVFSCATVVIGSAENIASLSFIDNRDFPGVKGLYPPGPVGYMAMTCSGAAGIAPSLGALLGYLLADGLLVRRFSDLRLTVLASNAYSSSSIVVTLPTAKRSGSSPSPVFCTLPPLVRI